MPRRSFSLVLCYAAMMALATAVNLMPVFVGAVSEEFGGLSEEQKGRIAAMSFLGLVAAIVGSGPLVDRLPAFGVKVFAIGGNVLIAVGLFLLATAHSYPMVLAASFVMGLGAGALDMILSPIISALRPEKRTVALNLLHAFYCIGAVLTILVASEALDFGIGWRTATMYIIPFSGLVALGFMFADIPPLVAEDAERMPLRKLMRSSFFILAMAAITLGGATELGLAYWLPTYAGKDHLGFPKITADRAFLAFNLAMAVGRLGIGFIGHRISTVNLLLLCSVGTVLLFVAAAFAMPGVALAACILTGLTGSTLWPSTLALASDKYPHGGASMFAVLGALGNAGGIIMPWVMGLIADRSNLAMGVAVGGLCPLLMIFTLLPMKKMSSGQHAENAPAS